MYAIKRSRVGSTVVYDLSFGGVVTADEMKQWVQESRKALATAPKAFTVRVDMRELKPLAPDVQAIMEEGQALYKKGGMTRSAVLLSNALIKLQFERLAKQSGIYEWERYFSEKEPGYDQAIENWLTQAA